MNTTFSILFLAGFLFLLAVEIFGIVRKKSGDTITEGWHAIDKWLNAPLQWAWRVLTAGLLVWVLFHLGGNWS